MATHSIPAHPQPPGEREASWSAGPYAAFSPPNHHLQNALMSCGDSRYKVTFPESRLIPFADEFALRGDQTAYMGFSGITDADERQAILEIHRD